MNFIRKGGTHLIQKNLKNNNILYFRSAIQHQDMEDEPVTKHPGKCDDEVGPEALPRVAPRQQALPELRLVQQQEQSNVQSK